MSKKTDSRTSPEVHQEEERRPGRRKSAPGVFLSTKILYIYDYLFRNTDENHFATTEELTRHLTRLEVPAERKSIYSYIDALVWAGADIQFRKKNGWFLGNRTFELPELKLLVDAVQCSRFITQKKSDALIRKLESLCSVYQADRLHRDVYVDGRAKVMNEGIYYNVDMIHAAISDKRTVTFRYFDLDIRRNQIFRRGGERYVVTPFALIYNNDNYYLVGFDHAKRSLRNYRVDKMSRILDSDEPQQGKDLYPDFQVAQYAESHFGMFSGETVTVTLRCRRSMSNVIWDRFGLDLIMVPDGPDYFRVQVLVALSPQFFGWIFGLEGGVTVVSPPTAVKAYDRLLKQAMRLNSASSPKSGKAEVPEPSSESDHKADTDSEDAD